MCIITLSHCSGGKATLWFELDFVVRFFSFQGQEWTQLLSQHEWEVLKVFRKIGNLNKLGNSTLWWRSRLCLKLLPLSLIHYYLYYRHSIIYSEMSSKWDFSLMNDHYFVSSLTGVVSKACNFFLHLTLHFSFYCGHLWGHWCIRFTLRIWNKMLDSKCTI